MKETISFIKVDVESLCGFSFYYESLNTNYQLGKANDLLIKRISSSNF